jgi:hypothetical protein
MINAILSYYRDSYEAEKFNCSTLDRIGVLSAGRAAASKGNCAWTGFENSTYDPS